MIFIYPAIVSDKIDERYLHGIIKTLEKYYLMHIKMALANRHLGIAIDEARGGGYFIESMDEFVDGNFLFETTYINDITVNASNDYNNILRVSNSLNDGIDFLLSGTNNTIGNTLFNHIKDIHDTFEDSQLVHNATSTVGALSNDNAQNLYNSLNTTEHQLHRLWDRRNNVVSNTNNNFLTDFLQTNHFNESEWIRNLIAFNQILNRRIQQGGNFDYSGRLSSITNSRPDARKPELLNFAELRNLIDQLINYRGEILTLISEYRQANNNNNNTRIPEELKEELKTTESNLNEAKKVYIEKLRNRKMISDHDRNPFNYNIQNQETLKSNIELAKNYLSNYEDRINQANSMYTILNPIDHDAATNIQSIISELTRDRDNLREAVDVLEARSKQLESAKEISIFIGEVRSFISNPSNINSSNLEKFENYLVRLNELRSKLSDINVNQNIITSRTSSQSDSLVNDIISAYDSLENDLKNIIRQIKNSIKTEKTNITYQELIKQSENQYSTDNLGLEQIRKTIIRINELLDEIKEELQDTTLSQNDRNNLEVQRNNLNTLLGKLKQREKHIEFVINNSIVDTIISGEYTRNIENQINHYTNSEDIPNINILITNVDETIKDLRHKLSIYDNTYRDKDNLEKAIAILEKFRTDVLYKKIKEIKNNQAQQLLQYRNRLNIILQDNPGVEAIPALEALSSDIQNSKQKLIDLNDPSNAKLIKGLDLLQKRISSEIQKRKNIYIALLDNLNQRLTSAQQNLTGSELVSELQAIVGDAKEEIDKLVKLNDPRYNNILTTLRTFINKVQNLINIQKSNFGQIASNYQKRFNDIRQISGPDQITQLESLRTELNNQIDDLVKSKDSSYDQLIKELRSTLKDVNDLLNTRTNTLNDLINEYQRRVNNAQRNFSGAELISELQNILKEVQDKISEINKIHDQRFAQPLSELRKIVDDIHQIISKQKTDFTRIINDYRRKFRIIQASHGSDQLSQAEKLRDDINNQISELVKLKDSAYDQLINDLGDIVNDINTLIGDRKNIEATIIDDFNQRINNATNNLTGTELVSELQNILVEVNKEIDVLVKRNDPRYVNNIIELRRIATNIQNLINNQKEEFGQIVVNYRRKFNDIINNVRGAEQVTQLENLRNDINNQIDELTKTKDSAYYPILRELATLVNQVSTVINDRKNVDAAKIQQLQNELQNILRENDLEKRRERLESLEAKIQTQLEELNSVRNVGQQNLIQQLTDLQTQVQNEIRHTAERTAETTRARRAAASFSINTSDEFNILPTMDDRIEVDVRFISREGRSSYKREMVPIGVKVVAIKMSTNSDIFKVLTDDIYRNYITSHFIAFNRWFMKRFVNLPIINRIYQWYRKFKSGFNREYTDVYYDILLRDKRYIDASAFKMRDRRGRGYQYYASSIVILSDYDIREQDQNFFEDPWKVRILYRMGWNSFIIMNDRIEKLVFCSNLENGMCVRVPYAYLFKGESQKIITRLESMKSFAGGVMSHFKRVPFKNLKKIIEK